MKRKVRIMAAYTVVGAILPLGWRWLVTMLALVLVDIWSFQNGLDCGYDNAASIFLLRHRRTTP